MGGKHSTRNWLLLCFVNLCWAAQYPAYRVASESMGPGALNFWTFAISSAVLLPFLIRERLRTAGARPAGKGAWLDFTLLAVLGLIPPSVLLAWGIAHSSASNAAILALTIPVLMVLMGVFLLGERPGRFYLLSLALALLGTVLISRKDLAGGSFSSDMLAGNAAIFVGGAGSAFYNTFGKRVLRRFSELEVLIYGYVVAMALCAAISLRFEPVAFHQVTRWGMAAWGSVFILGGISWGVAMVIWMWLLKQLEVAQISISVYLLPVLGVLVSTLSLGERLTVVQIAGGVVVFAAAYFSSGASAETPTRSKPHRR